ELEPVLSHLKAECAAAKQRVRSPEWLAPRAGIMPTPESYAQRSDLLVGEYRLFPREFVAQRACVLEKRLDAARVEAEDRCRERGGMFGAVAPASGGTLRARSSRCVPVKTFRGFLGFEESTLGERQQLRDIGVEIGWGAPMWLQQALFLANGKRTVDTIRDVL